MIGNSRYSSAVGPLRNTVNDAKAVARALRGLGFSVIEDHNVTRDELLRTMLRFRRKIGEAEVALFYYAGHGISLGGSNYLVPVRSGFSPQVDDPAALRLLAETKLFNADQAVAEMGASDARCNLVILDACRNTPIARNPRERSTASGGLSEMTPPAGSLIAFAIITETVFQWPGMGLLFLQAIQFVDIPVMAAYLCLVAFIFVVINLIVDLLYYLIDPRLRLDGIGRAD